MVTLRPFTRRLIQELCRRPHDALAHQAIGTSHRRGTTTRYTGSPGCLRRSSVILVGRYRSLVDDADEGQKSTNDSLRYGLEIKFALLAEGGKNQQSLFFFRASFLRFYFRFELRHSCDSRSNNNLTLRTSGFHLCCKRYIVVVAMIDSHIKMINLTEINNTVSSYDGGDRDNGEGYEYS